MLEFYTIAGDCSYLDNLASWWVNLKDQDSDNTGYDLILTPNYSSAKQLKESFHKILINKAKDNSNKKISKPSFEYPDIAPIFGTNDREKISWLIEDMKEAQSQNKRSKSDFYKPLKLIDPVTCNLFLTSLLKDWLKSAEGIDRKPHPWGDMNFSQLYNIAQDVAGLHDEFILNEVSKDSIAKCVEEKFTDNWRLSLNFFDEVILDKWDKLLKKEGLKEKYEWEQSIIERRIKSWSNYKKRPYKNIIIAGTTGRQKSTVRLLQSLKDTKGIKVVLANFDRNLYHKDRASVLEACYHPQHVMFKFLDSLKAKDVTAIAEEGSKAKFARKVFSLSGDFSSSADDKSDHISSYSFRNHSEEALAIALWLYEAYLKPDMTAMCVTPNLKLSRRVVNILECFGLKIPVGAGQPLSTFPISQFLLEVCSMYRAQHSGVKIMSLLKNRFSFVLDRERKYFLPIYEEILRSLNVGSGTKEVLKIAQNPDHLSKFLKKKDTFAKEFSVFCEKVNALCSPLIIDEEEKKGANIWIKDLQKNFDKIKKTPANTEGEGHIKATLNKLASKNTGFMQITGAELENFMAQIMQSSTIYESYQEHPRIKIVGVLESRLLTADRVIIADFNEGTWPTKTKDSPWISRDMRKNLKMEDADTTIGLTAHEVESLFSYNEVIISRALTVDGSPSLPSRWLVRLSCLDNECFDRDDVSKLDIKGAMAALINPKHPRGVMKQAPYGTAQKEHGDIFWVNDIRDLVNNNFSYYARRILNLRAKESLHKQLDGRSLGIMVHDLFMAMLEDIIKHEPPDAWQEILSARFRQEIASRFASESDVIYAVWGEYFNRLAKSFAHHIKNNVKIATDFYTEKTVAYKFDAFSNITLKGRVDRLDLTPNKILVIDYKTGSSPSTNDIKTGKDPQMPVLMWLTEKEWLTEKSTKVETYYWKVDRTGIITEEKAAETSQDWDGYFKNLNDFLNLIKGKDYPFTPAKNVKFDEFQDFNRRREWSLDGDLFDESTD